MEYRKLSGVSSIDAYPMPRIDELADRLGKARFITTLVLMKGYWQVLITKRARPKTGFVTLLVLFQFNVMPFDLK